MAWVRKVTAYPSWTAGARSIATLTGDGEYTFHAGPSVGIVAGLNDNDQSGDYKEISHGFYISNTYTKVIESGVLKTTWYNYNSFYELAIRRVGGVVSYLLDGIVIYTSDVLSYGTVFFDCSLYADGDTITDLTCTETFNPSANSQGLALSPLISFGTTDDYVGRCLLEPLGLSTVVDGQNSDTTVYLSLSPLISLGSEDGNFGRARLSPLSVTAGDDIVPDYNLGAVSLNALTVSWIISDTLTAALSLSPLDALGSNTNDGIGFASFEPLSMYADTLLDNHFLFFLPMFTGFTGYNDAILTIPAPILTAEATVHTSGVALTIPAPTLTARCGAVARNTLPAPALVSTGTVQRLARAALELPAPTLTVTGKAGTIAVAAITIPAPTITTRCGATTSLKLLAPHLAATGRVQAIARATLELPAIQITATGTTYGRATAALEIPLPLLYAGIGNRAALEIPAPILSAIATLTSTAETTYAINLSTGAVTQLLLGGFDKLVTAHGRLYGLKAGALTRLDGDVDGTVTTIPATIRFAPQTFGTNAVKRMSDVYWSSREGDGMTMELVADERTLWRYQTPTDTAPAFGTHKIKTGRGVTFHTAGLTVRNRNGGALDIGGVELLVTPLSRKPL